MRGEDGLIDTAALVAGVVERATDAVFTYEFTYRNVTGLFRFENAIDSLYPACSRLTAHLGQGCS